MTPHWADESVTVFHGDCLEVMRELDACSVDAVCTDPPYNLSFMAKAWDAHESPAEFQSWCEQWAAECLRVLKPGGHMLAFGGTRTWHRLACAVEDAGFEVRDSIAWLYGSGFPKSLDVSKAIDKAAGVEREVIGFSKQQQQRTPAVGTSSYGDYRGQSGDITAPATDDAQTWQGWGTALKPAHEPIVVARKPLVGTVAANVLQHGTGALNIDACRIGTDTSRGDRYNGKPPSKTTGIAHVGINDEPWEAAAGRWPANVTLDESQAAALDEQVPNASVNAPAKWRSASGTSGGYGDGSGIGAHEAGQVRGGYGDSGGASRFFYITRETQCTPAQTDDSTNSAQPAGAKSKLTTRATPKAGESTTGTHSTSGLDGLQGRFFYVPKADTNQRPRTDNTAHPTVKPLDLMRWLVRLITPPGGIVLDPFAGSGTTAEACIIEGFHCVTIEREADYLPLIVQRLSKPIEPVMF